MRITLLPIYMDAEISLSRSSDMLVINGDALDFSDLPDGGEYPPEAIDNEFVIGGVRRIDGVIHIAILLPYTNPNAPRSVTFPEPVLVSADGLVELPEGRYLLPEPALLAEGEANAD